MTGHLAEVFPPKVTSAAGLASAGGARAAAATTAATTLRWILPILLLLLGRRTPRRLRRRGGARQHPWVVRLTPWWRGRHVGGLGAGSPGAEHRWHADTTRVHHPDRAPAVDRPDGSPGARGHAGCALRRAAAADADRRSRDALARTRPLARRRAVTEPGAQRAGGEDPGV